MAGVILLTAMTVCGISLFIKRRKLEKESIEPVEQESTESIEQDVSCLLYTSPSPRDA